MQNNVHVGTYVLDGFYVRSVRKQVSEWSGYIIPCQFDDLEKYLPPLPSPLLLFNLIFLTKVQEEQIHFASLSGKLPSKLKFSLFSYDL